MERSNVRKLLTYFAAFLSGDVATHIESIAVAWHIFTLHHRPFDLGLVADRHDRKAVLIVATLAEIATALTFLALVLAHIHRLGPYLGAVLAIGVARAFGVPGQRGMLLALVSSRD